MSSSSDEESYLTPKEFNEHDSNAEFSFLPEKSREKYLKAYELFNNWRLSKDAETYTEPVLLSYFMELSKTRTASTLWSIYSMLKAVNKTKRDADLETCPKLVAFLKRKAEGYKSKKSRVFTANEIEKFLNDAPDFLYLCLKVGVIVGIHGACRSNELLNLTINDIERHSDKLILVKLLNTTTKIYRSFVIREKYVTIIDKYVALRPAHTKTKRFFLQYHNGKCKIQPMGINKIGEIPRKVATFLKLPDPHLYTGHCLRRTSAILLGDSGADLSVLKCDDGLNSSSDGEVDVEDPIESKPALNDIEPVDVKPIEFTIPSNSKENDAESCTSPGTSSSPPGCSNEESEVIHHNNVNNMTITVPHRNITFNLKNCSNFTFHF